MIKSDLNKSFFSFEVFPPKKESSIDTVYKTLDDLSGLHPDFISVTYGAGGSENCSKTLDIAKRIKETCKVESVIHLPCLHLTKNEAETMLKTFADNGIENLLVLRGDPIEGRNPCGDFFHASDMCKFINEKMPGKFHLMGACYPENHPDSKDTLSEISNLKTKVESGADHLLSQLFFENEKFYHFVENCRLGGINVPIEAGIMPVTNKAQIERMTERCGVLLPEKYKVMLEKYQNDPASLFEAGIAYAVSQIVDLICHNVNGIHLYTMNNAAIAKRICDAIEAMRKN
ncbi:methylenetetrahydrofolate reductase [NAD(P)H] [Treponema sp.]|uniref:methylenetetrahydrofolate reductase [NAD(P)H] n=1 Tax=Treponema sp. TaxID=166 RepID=UPI00298E4C0F|nr:methylenetetrahydrofolate reductase [NAD(P)H] [Treponema sp.]